MPDDEESIIPQLIMPMIAEADYPAFQGVITGLPDTYQDWLRDHEPEKESGKSGGNSGGMLKSCQYRQTISANTWPRLAGRRQRMNLGSVP
jgi:hypothetical protein